jgi:hypothetical protein
MESSAFAVSRATWPLTSPSSKLQGRGLGPGMRDWLKPAAAQPLSHKMCLANTRFYRCPTSHIEGGEVEMQSLLDKTA